MLTHSPPSGTVRNQPSAVDSRACSSSSTTPTTVAPSQAGQHVFQHLPAPTTMGAIPTVYGQPTPQLTFDPNTFSGFDLSPRQRLDQLKVQLPMLSQHMGDANHVQHNQRLIQSIFETLASLDGSSALSVLRPAAHATFRNMLAQCDQPLQRKQWQRFIDRV
ncbi:MAG: hypothetical protein EOP39_22450, partial [Rubrivivax sp.]